MPEDEIIKIFRQVKEQIKKNFYHDQHPGLHQVNLFFYGAGCIGKHIIEKLNKCASDAFGSDTITNTYSDILGAARATLGNNHGIICILGTGSNSALYDGMEIKNHIPSLGYILGDEGSGSALGKRLLNRYFKGPMVKQNKQLLESRYVLDEPLVLHNIYHEAGANRYLASFVPFLADFYKESEELKLIITEEFHHFFKRNICRYDNYKEYSLSFVGSIAYIFKDLLHDVAESYGIRIDKIVQTPIQGLVTYHKNL